MISEQQYEFFEIRGPRRVVRRAPGGSVAELTSDGWLPAPWLEKKIAQEDTLDVAGLGQRSRQRLSAISLMAPTRKTSPCKSWWRRASQVAVPPLDFGAPRHLDESSQDAGESAYDAELPPDLPEGLTEELVTQARDGYQRQGERVAGIERRAALFQGGASLSGGLIVSGTALATEHDRLADPVLRWVILVGFVFVSLFLLAAGWRAYQASVYTFTWARPTIRRKILSRARKGSVAAARRSLLTALLLGQDRGQVIAQWKLDRLKQATRCFLLAVMASLALTITFILSL